MAFASNVDENQTFEITEGKNENQIIITENGESFVLETFVESGIKYINLYDSSNNLISSDSISFSEFKTLRELNSSDQLLNASTYNSKGSGTKKDTYKYCTPGKVKYIKDKLSYAQIAGMAGSALSAVTIVKAIATLSNIAIFDFTSTAGKALVAEVINILSSNNSSNWLSKHGVNLKFKTTCTLQNYKDGAWGDNEWFYVESVSLQNFSKY